MSNSTIREWNRRHPVGTPVEVWPLGRQEDSVLARTRGRAWEAPDGTCVVPVAGIPGGIPLDLVHPIGVPGYITLHPGEDGGARMVCTRHDRDWSRTYTGEEDNLAYAAWAAAVHAAEAHPEGKRREEHDQKR